MTLLPALLCVCLGLSSLSLASPVPDHADAVPDGKCKICGHQLQILTMAMSSWSTLINATVAAQRKGASLNLNKDQYSFQEFLSGFDEEADEDDCHRDIAALKNTLWSVTQEALKPDSTPEALTEATRPFRTLLKAFASHKLDNNPKWDLYFKKIDIFKKSTFLQYDERVGQVANEVVRSGGSDARLVGLINSYPPYYHGDRMDNVLNGIYTKGSKVNRELTERVIALGEKVWPSEELKLHKKLSAKLSEIHEE